MIALAFIIGLFFGGLLGALIAAVFILGHERPGGKR